ncbi:glycosyltransferase [Rhodovarius sp.]|uniref:glycosyltransferase n=1 Tax=Rhodovarius sp. TaxID=2972673 RepID=UPI00333EE869
MKITVLSTFDVWPAIDGGQMRYCSIWTKFSNSNAITILPYEFRNTAQERRYHLAPHVEVWLPKAAAGDARHFHHMMEVSGLWMHDVLCIADYTLSPEYLCALHSQLADCDVLVAAHPYLAAMAFALAPARVLTVYESYNVEYDIKAQYLSTGSASRNLMGRYLRQVEQVERLAVQRANHVTAVSEADRQRLAALYGVPTRKISLVPNGVNAPQAPSLPAAAAAQLRAEMGLGGAVIGIIVASSHAPNVESYRRTRLMLQEAGFTGTILLVGNIATALQPDWPDIGFEERVFGFVSDALKITLLECADFAPHFIFDGAGTNLKLFEYMGHGVPIIANGFGVRGTEGDDWYWPTEDAAGLRRALADIATHPLQARARAERGRAIARARFDWAAIATGFEAAMRQGFPRSPTEAEAPA